MSGTEIATDLLTPLGAYLRLREGARGAFLLESVERGRLGRHSFVGAGSRIVVVRGGGDARRAGRRLPRLRRRRDASSRRCRCRSDGPDAPESRWLVPDVLLRFDHARGVAELLRGETRAARRAEPTLPARHGAARPARARAVARRAPPPRRAREGAHPRGRRLPGRRSRSAPSARPRRRPSSSTARCAASTRRRTSSSWSSATSRSSAARRRRSSSAAAAAPS